MDNKDIYCVIMAGGIGSRFWPLSRSDKPKQFLDILGVGKSLIQQTFERVTMFCNPENVYVVTGVAYKDQVLEHLPGISERQVILEPIRRNTAPCIAYANQRIMKQNPNAVVVVAPSDHLIMNENEFAETIRAALKFALEQEALLTIGIKPNRPDTGYGYIQIGEEVNRGMPRTFKVKTFTEKPNVEMAEIFIKSGEFFWNSGVFIWSLKAINNAFEKHLPEVYSLFNEIQPQIGTADEQKSVTNVYSECRNISIDYGIMEKAENVYVICSEFGWSDLGSWTSLYVNSVKDKSGNAIYGDNVLTYGTTNTLINVSGDKLLVIQGLKDYIVVETDNVLLICSKENEHEIKNYHNDVINDKGDRFT
ncbi:MAG: mannose-1-phosphate guanylyltransferase [Rikenellaceae bacterium]|nr:mannose-1-phosphate guanylyltransferase [Bacteroidales bacterium]NLH56949.1 mannose-1-phosphate guanylyltransferase [Rikenellaceae bacterium]